MVTYTFLVRPQSWTGRNLICSEGILWQFCVELPSTSCSAPWLQYRCTLNNKRLVRCKALRPFSDPSSSLHGRSFDFVIWKSDRLSPGLTEVKMTVSLTFVSEVGSLTCSWELNKQSLCQWASSALGSCWRGCLGSSCIMVFPLALLVLGSVTAVCHWTLSIPDLLEMCLGELFFRDWLDNYCFQTLVHFARLKPPMRTVLACRPRGFIGEWTFTLQRYSSYSVAWVVSRGVLGGFTAPIPLSLLYLKAAFPFLPGNVKLSLTLLAGENLFLMEHSSWGQV